jgi:hypothetical protein
MVTDCHLFEEFEGFNLDEIVIVLPELGLGDITKIAIPTVKRCETAEKFPALPAIVGANRPHLVYQYGLVQAQDALFELRARFLEVRKVNEAPFT